MDLSPDVRNYLARRWFNDLLGRQPKADEQAFRAEQIRTTGVDLTYAAIYDSAEARAFRTKRGW